MPVDADTLQVTFSVVESSLQEILIAELSERGFDAFNQSGPDLQAFASPSVWTDELRTFIKRWLAAHGSSAEFTSALIPAENWNAQWEASLDAIEVGRFTIKPSWKELDAGSDRIVIEIDPKMSFGTGYHASTRLALRLLENIVRPGDRVLDAGTGTGILSIAASKLGASFVFAFDNDPWAYRNTLENIRRNDVDQTVTTRLGGIDCVPDSLFDVVLANIHLTVIREMTPTFVSRLMPEGSIIVSGLLLPDESEIKAVAEEFGLVVSRALTEDEWYAAALTSR